MNPSSGSQPSSVPSSKVVPPQSHKPTEEDLSPVALDDDPTEPIEMTARKIRTFGFDGSNVSENRPWNRTPGTGVGGACRVRSFHGKYSDEGLRFLDQAINTWLDEHAEVEVKFVTSTVMTFEGKIREPALVLNLWY